MEGRQPLIGTAGWTIRAEHREAFPADGSQLKRYAARFNAVEINSSFYRPHRRATYERWAETVGEDFRFAVKLPKTISHARFVDDLDSEVARFAEEVTGLGDKLGMVLIQLPPSRAYEEPPALQLLTALGDSLPCRLACEPRHPTWFGNDAEAMLDRLHIARVAADPAILPSASVPGGWLGARYHRLHGSPKIYYSNYEASRLEAVRATLASEASAGLDSWCILDNTALGFATANARELRAGFERGSMERPIEDGMEPE
jgi:uncharacterized protein YecE (DUF72 family)